MVRSFTFSQRLHSGFVGTVLLTVVIAVAAVQAIRSVAGSRQVYTAVTQQLVAVERLRVDAGEKVSAGRALLITGDPAFRKAAAASRADFLSKLSDLRSAARDARMRAQLDRVGALEASQQSAFEHVLAAAGPDTSRAAIARVIERELLPQTVRLNEALSDLAGDVEEEVTSSRSLLEASVTQTTRHILVVSAGALGLAVLLGLLLTRTLATLWRNQQRTTASAEAARERYADLVEGLGGVIVWEADPATQRPTFVSPAAERMLGIPVAAAGDPAVWREHIPEDDVARFRRAIEACGSAVPQQIDHRILDAHGRPRWFHTAIHLARVPGGTVLRGLSVDITRLREADEGLRIHAQQQAAVAQLGQRALTAADLVALFADACSLAVWTLAVDAAGVFRDCGAGELELAAGTGWQEGSVGGARIGRDAEGVREALRSGAPVPLDAYGSSRARMPALLRQQRAESAVAVPLGGGDGVGDVLVVLSRSPRSYSPDDLHFLQSIANVLASAADRARAEARVRDSEQRLRLFVDSVEDYAMIMLDAEGRVVGWNSGAEHIGGYRADEVLGRSFELFTPPEEHADASRLLVAAARDGKADEEGWRRRKDGSLVWVDLTVSAIRDGVGRLVGFACVVRDVTERKRAEDVMRLLVSAGEALSQTLDFERTVEVVARLGLGRFCDACAVLALDAGNMAPRTAAAAVDALFEPRLAAALSAPRGSVRDALEVVLRTGAPLRGDGQPGSPTIYVDSSRPVAAWLAVPLVARSRTLGAVLFLATNPARRYEPRDLAVALELARRGALALDNARLYREAQQAVHARDQFLSIASHELKTPLTSLRLNVQSLLRSADHGSESVPLRRLRPKLDVIERQSDRLSKLVNGLLDISHITGGELQLSGEAIDLSELVRETVGDARGDLERARCRVDLTVPEHLVGHWDRPRLGQIVRNLLSNAMKYGSGRPVEIRLQEREGQAVLSVRDHGIGIASEDRARIFERFERAVSERHYGGFGLGLWTVRQIVRALGGEIEVDSEPGRGSTFTVSLPLEPAALETPSAAAEQPPALH